MVGVTAVGLALLGHVTAGGATAPPSTLLIFVLLVFLASLGMSGRRWTLGPLLGMLFGSQLVFHLALGAGMAAHVHHGQPGGAGSAMAGHPGLAMLAAHTIAALLTALLLRRGENCVRRVVELLSRAWRIARVAVGPVTAPASRVVTNSGSALPSRLHLLEDAVARRGPPASAA